MRLAKSSDAFILLDVTIKNMSDYILDLEDLMESMEVTENLAYSGLSVQVIVTT